MENKTYYNCVFTLNNEEQNKKVIVTDKSLSDELTIKNINKLFLKKFNVVPQILGPFIEEPILDTTEETSEPEPTKSKLTCKNVTLVCKKITGTYKKWRIIGYHIEEDPDLIYTIFLTNSINNKLGPELINKNKILQDNGNDK